MDRRLIYFLIIVMNINLACISIIEISSDNGSGWDLYQSNQSLYISIDMQSLNETLDANDGFFTIKEEILR